jgi:hypothetical protein
VRHRASVRRVIVRSRIAEPVDAGVSTDHVATTIGMACGCAAPQCSPPGVRDWGSASWRPRSLMSAGVWVQHGGVQRDDRVYRDRAFGAPYPRIFARGSISSPLQLFKADPVVLAGIALAFAAVSWWFAGRGAESEKSLRQRSTCVVQSVSAACSSFLSLADRRRSRGFGSIDPAYL